MKKPEYHYQRNMETCGICCLLMALDAFGIEYASVSRQERYYEDYGAKSTPGTLGSAIAYVLYFKGIKKGLNIKIVHASEKLLENHGGYFEEEIFRNILDEHKSWLKAAENVKALKKLPEESFVCVGGHYFDCDELSSELEKGGLVITQVFIPGEGGETDKVMHWILLYGEDAGIFNAIDPMPKPVGGNIKLSADELEEYMNTPFERTYISVWENGD
ncbi:MAG: hypothetical protein E7420_01505 [Ruminococcaceae bacterium]|nr:hypothetical protein [Oscillospiraceae bacterium]